MVIVFYKKTEKNGFAVQCSLQTKISSLLDQIIEINNLRVYLDRLIWSVDELANKGVLKPADLQGVSWQDFQKHYKEFESLPEQFKQYGKKPIVEPPYKYVADKHNQRYGVVLPDQTKQILLRAVQNARKIMEVKQQPASKQELVNTVENIREAVAQAYPGYIDLPEWEPSLLMLEEKIDLQILQTESFQIFDERGTVWWAGKEMEKDKCLYQYVGKNEKTKVIVKVQKWGGQQPLRQPPIDAQTYQTMVKYYYKKVQQTKQLEKKSVETHYDKIQTTSLKAKLHLEEQGIKFKPF